LSGKLLRSKPEAAPARFFSIYLNRTAAEESNVAVLTYNERVAYVHDLRHALVHTSFTIQ